MERTLCLLHEFRSSMLLFEVRLFPSLGLYETVSVWLETLPTELSD